MGTLSEQLFRNPDEEQLGLLHLGAAFLFFGLFIYYRLFRDVQTLLPILLGTLFTLTALPELLAHERTRLAGLLRIAGVVYAAALVVVALVWPSVL